MNPTDRLCRLIRLSMVPPQCLETHVISLLFNTSLTQTHLVFKRPYWPTVLIFNTSLTQTHLVFKRPYWLTVLLFNTSLTQTHLVFKRPYWLTVLLFNTSLTQTHLVFKRPYWPTVLLFYTEHGQLASKVARAPGVPFITNDSLSENSSVPPTKSMRTSNISQEEIYGTRMPFSWRCTIGNRQKIDFFRLTLILIWSWPLWRFYYHTRTQK